MQPQGLWLVLAGFVLGFAVSTLWEWLYYRRQRWLRLQALQSLVRPSDDLSISPFEEEQVAPPLPERVAPDYRSPGIYLESEQGPLSQAASSPTRLRIAPAADWLETEVDLLPREGEALAATLIAPPRVDQVLGQEGVDTAPLLPAPAAEEPAARPMVASLSTSAALEAGVAPPVALPVPQPPPAEPEFVGRVEMVRAGPPEEALVIAKGEGATAAASVVARPLGVASESAREVPLLLPTLPMFRGLGARSSDYPDDLSKIRGIGEIYKQRLYAAGIYTWQQVADADVESLRQITRAKPNADLADWQTQARSLIKRFNRMGALYHGPPPDDLTLIEGIGPTVRDALYRAGIATYAQLAATPAATLEQILPAPTIGSTYHFTDWIEQASRRVLPQI